MQKAFTVVALFLSFALIAGATGPAPAESSPRMETFLGYNFARFNPDSGYIPSFNANGGSGQFTYNFSRWFGITTDIGAVHKSVLNAADVDTTITHFVAGPRVSFHNSSRFTPFGEIMFGGSHTTTSTQISALPVVNPLAGITLPGDVPVSARLTASNTVFAMMVGGGLDYRVSKHVSFRPFAADYYLTRPASLISGQDVNKNNWRLSAGVSFLFGEPQ